MGKPPQIVWTHPLLPFPNSVQRLLLLLIPSNRANHIEVVPCVVQVHRPLLEIIAQLSVDIMRGVPLPQAKWLAVGVDRCLEEMGQAQHLNVSPPGAVSVHMCGSYITLNTVMASEMVA